MYCITQFGTKVQASLAADKKKLWNKIDYNNYASRWSLKQQKTILNLLNFLLLSLEYKFDGDEASL
jgi:hypothetical protein